MQSNLGGNVGSCGRAHVFLHFTGVPIASQKLARHDAATLCGSLFLSFLFSRIFPDVGSPQDRKLILHVLACTTWNKHKNPVMV
jgi:hypothetical protein